jgi:hypothetical protein
MRTFVILGFGIVMTACTQTPSVADLGSGVEAVGTTASRLDVIDNHAFVGGIYQRFLGRAPDEAFDVWVAALEGGATRQAVIDAIIASPSGRDVVSLIASQPDQIGYAHIRLLGRTVDTDSVAVWSDLGAAQGYGAVASGLLGTDEFALTVVPQLTVCPWLASSGQLCTVYASGFGLVDNVVCSYGIDAYATSCSATF